MNPEVRAEAFPATVTHWMPDNSHIAGLHCWCHPTPQNGMGVKGTTVQHPRYAGPAFRASKTD